MWTGRFFTAGLISFLVGHVFYIIALLEPVSFSNIPFGVYILVLPFIFYGVFIYKNLLPYLKSMKIHAFLYLTVILIMSFSSLLRICSINNYQFWMPFLGALLFISSDTMLAFNQFRGKGREEYIMITYIAAQLLIVLGFML